jgi:acetyl-CoA carboxylase carboxyltransferase component
VTNDGWPTMEELLTAVEQVRSEGLDESRPAAMAKQHDRGKLTARERVDRLTDPGSFQEWGALARPINETPFPVELDAPGDGVVTGSALIDGRPATVVSYDFTQVGGSVGPAGTRKVERAFALSLEHGMPLVLIQEGGGHRIQDGLDSRHFAFAGGEIGMGHHFVTQAKLSGWAPIVTAVTGPGFAGPTNFAAMSDFVVMIRGQSTMGMAGPALVKAGTGEETDNQALGGAELQVDRYGLADYAVADEEDCLRVIKRYLSFFPQNAGEPPLIVECDDPIDRADEELLELVPVNTRKAYDVRRVIEHIADRGSTFELKPTFAKNLVTTLARLNGRPVGFIANNPMSLAGILDANAAEKGARFIAQCDAFGLPLVYLVDVPGFMIGSSAERTTLGKRSGKLLYELAQATVPRLSVVMRKGYGLGYFAMNGGRGFDAELSVAWPQAEICAMSVEGAVDVAYRRQYEAADDPAGERAALIAMFKGNLGALYGAEGMGIDDVIDPRETRRHLITTLDRCQPRRRPSMPPKFRSIPPI